MMILDVFWNNLPNGVASTLALVNSQKRGFSSSHLCGALAIAFLYSMLVKVMLPVSYDDTVNAHHMLREKCCQALIQSQITHRPWIWGAGDHDAPAPEVDANLDTPIAPSSSVNTTEALHPMHPITSTDLSLYEQVSSQPARHVPGVSRSHQCPAVDARIDLINSHGMAMADDEIRFHVPNLIIQSAQNVSKQPRSFQDLFSLTL